MGNENKPFTIFGIDDISENILEIILENNSFKKSTIFGEKGLGDPDEMEELIIVFDEGIEKTFKYINKGIHYLIKGDNTLQPVFKVFAYFMMKERGR